MAIGVERVERLREERGEVVRGLRDQVVAEADGVRQVVAPDRGGGGDAGRRRAERR